MSEVIAPVTMYVNIGFGWSLNISRDAHVGYLCTCLYQVMFDFDLLFVRFFRNTLMCCRQLAGHLHIFQFKNISRLKVETQH
jgi:hypothetical protein